MRYRNSPHWRPLLRRGLKSLHATMAPAAGAKAGAPLGVSEAHHMSEALTQVLYDRVLKPGDTALDIGANRGRHTVEMAARVGAGGRIHAFEPNPAHLVRLASLGGNITVWPFAVGSTLALATLYIPSTDDGWASLNDRAEILPQATISRVSVVQLVLDDIEELAAAPVVFVKLDVEERELDALKGMQGLLARARSVVVLENPSAEIVLFLAGLDYEVLDLLGRPYVAGALPFPNALARPREAGPTIVEATTIPQSVVDFEGRAMRGRFRWSG